MEQYIGTPIIPGIAVGPVRKLVNKAERFSRIIESPEKEILLFQKALWTAKAELLVLAERAPEEEQAIFTFQRCLMDDETMLKETYSAINSGMSAVEATEHVANIHAEELRNIQNEYLSLRAIDILDACRRIVDILDGHTRKALQLDYPVILAGEMLMPSDLFSVPAGMILGIAASAGSAQSHAAIIARSLGIPAIIQIGDDFLENCDGKTAVLDARTGTLILQPDARTRQTFIEQLYENQRKNQRLLALRELPNATKDNIPFKLFANCLLPEDIKYAVEVGASSIGILRTESLLFGGRVPSENEQFDFYYRCIKAASGVSITFRTFDLGANADTDVLLGKLLPTHALGFRGIRLGHAHPRVLETQLCALLRASAYGKMRIIFPMISSVDDWHFAIRAVEHCKDILRHRGDTFNENIKIGMLMEIPAACLMADDFVDAGCDFFAIGTNDLVQYTHAADRELSQLEPYYQTNSPAMKKLIRMVVKASQKANIPVSLNGLTLAKASNVVEYFDLGIHNFSLEAGNILAVKEILLSTQVQDFLQMASESSS